MGKTSHKDIEYTQLLAKAVRLRLAKTPYDEIISKLGHWKSIQACQKAVAGFLKRNQVKAVADSRAEAIARAGTRRTESARSRVLALRNARAFSQRLW